MSDDEKVAPADPFTAVAEGCIAMHLMFESLTRAGFTEDQALRLTAYLTSEARAHPGTEES